MISPTITAHSPVRATGQALRVVLATVALLALAAVVLVLGRASVPAGAAPAKAVAELSATREGVPAVPGLTKRQVSLIIAGLQTGSCSSVSQALDILSHL